jgi:ABC-type lipopolysaccharide export system ATPase subunit
MSISAENITWKVGKKVIVNNVSLNVSREKQSGYLVPMAVVSPLFCAFWQACVARIPVA